MIKNRINLLNEEFGDTVYFFSIQDRIREIDGTSGTRVEIVIPY